jgi:hypothetical protein
VVESDARRACCDRRCGLVPTERWWALGFLLLLALVGLFSAALWIHKRRHTEADEMDETRGLLEDLRDAAAWLFGLWP